MPATDRAREQLTPEWVSPRPEAPEALGGEERAASTRTRVERAAEPSVPLGPLVADDTSKPVAPLPGSAIDPKAVETVLEEDLEDIYRELPSDAQQRFRVAGEETARRVTELLQEVKLQVEKIMALIRSWLLLIPGVNKFFLEQTAKIKMDRLMRLRKPPET